MPSQKQAETGVVLRVRSGRSVSTRRALLIMRRRESRSNQAALPELSREQSGAGGEVASDPRERDRRPEKEVCSVYDLR